MTDEQKVATDVDDAKVTNNDESTVKVYYWNGRGKVEPLRILLAACNVKFTNVFFTEDNGYTMFEKLKKDRTLLYYQAPLLQMDGLNMIQTGAQFVCMQIYIFIELYIRYILIL